MAQNAGSFECGWLGDRAGGVWKRFLAASQRIEQRLDRELRTRHGISHTQYEILVQLADAGDYGLPMSDLADWAVTAKSAVTYQVGRLVERGFVARKECPVDGRRMYASITDDGKSLLGKVAPDHLALVRALFVDVLDEGQLDALDGMLDAWCGRLTDEAG
ncbi:MAG: MarR family winged helix-turn-helix transcriptional regulator [Stackebrandtia sp.]